MSDKRVPSGMTRRHFMEHVAGASALAVPAISFTSALRAHADDLKRRHKAAIMLWMGGGPATIDIWDLKPGAPTGGTFRPIATSGNEQICEHLPLTAKQMHHLSIVRSMSTREADHNRGRYYMHTGYVPNPNIEHPSYGSVVSHMLADQTAARNLEIPPFVAVGGGSVGPGFLGMTYAPFVVNSNGDVRNLKMKVDRYRLNERMRMLASLETNFIRQDRGQSAVDHAKVLDKTVGLMTSKQMDAFKVNQEDDSARERVRRHRFRTRLPDGPAAGRAGRALRRSRSRRLGHAPEQLPHALDQQAAGAGQSHERPGQRSGRTGHAPGYGHHLDGRVRPHAADQRQ